MIRDHLSRRLMRAIRHARRVREMGFSEQAAILWEKEYRSRLSEGHPGVLGSVTDRGAAIVRRIACLYALLDLKKEVQEPHLQAALEVWRYGLDSAKFLFGEVSQDPIEQIIVQGLRSAASNGMTSTEISNSLFHRNRGASEIRRALQHLIKDGRIRERIAKQEGLGRPEQRYFIV
jgi:hypothetical protein